MVAADFWIVAESPRRRDWRTLAAGLGVGLALGVAVATFAIPRIAPAPPETRVTRSWPHPALDRQWRGIRTPVDVDRMFRRSR
jgi:hypothetical protein